MAATIPPWTGRRAQAAVQWCKDNLGWTCWLCGHQIGEGDYSVDHVLPRMTHPELTWERGNWRPAHLRSKPAWGCPGNAGRGNRMRGRRPIVQAKSLPGW